MERKSLMLGLCMVFAALMLIANPAFEEGEDKVNINTAPLEELAMLKRIGPKYAQRIIEFRKQNPFEKPEDICKVPGIGEKTYEANKDVIVVE